MNKLALTIADTPFQAPPPIPNGGLATKGTALIQAGLNLFFLVGIVTAMALILYAGIQWAASGGDKQKVQAARNRLTYTIIGLLVLAGAFVILNIVLSLVGFNYSFFFNFNL